VIPNGNGKRGRQGFGGGGGRKAIET